MSQAIPIQTVPSENHLMDYLATVHESATQQSFELARVREQLRITTVALEEAQGTIAELTAKYQEKCLEHLEMRADMEVMEDKIKRSLGELDKALRWGNRNS